MHLRRLYAVMTVYIGFEELLIVDAFTPMLSSSLCRLDSLLGKESNCAEGFASSRRESLVREEAVALSDLGVGAMAADHLAPICAWPGRTKLASLRQRLGSCL